MTDNSNSTQNIELIERLQQSYSNVKVYTAVPMGVLMILYFFSYAMLIDRGMNGTVIFEIVTSILFVLYFFKINQAAFVILKFIHRKKAQLSDMLSLMNASDLAMEAGALSAVIESRR